MAVQGQWLRGMLEKCSESVYREQEERAESDVSIVPIHSH